MSKEPNKKRIGMFVFVCALLLGFLLLLFFGEQIFSKQRVRQVMYFNGSVSGLTAGSAVVFKGVPIGWVDKIELQTDENLTFNIAVYVIMNPGRVVSTNKLKHVSEEDSLNVIKQMIDRGLKAQLLTQSIITGQMIIQLDFYPNVSPVFRYALDEKDIMEIPTISSPIEELSRDLSNLPLRNTLESLNILVADLNRDLPELIANAKELIKTADKILTNVNGSESMLLEDISVTMHDLSAASKSLKNLTDYLERHPEAILKGKGKSE